MKQILLLLVLICFRLSVASPNPVDCGCDYTIPKDQEEIWYVPSPSVKSHQKYWPLKRVGETVICLEAGIRNRLYIRDFNGGIKNDGSKYVIKNCGGVSEIKTHDFNGITFVNCQDIKIIGSGDPNNNYGIKISETRYNGTNYGNAFGISIEGYSQKIEIAYVEITNTGFSAIAAKTDGGVYYPDKVTRFVLSDLRLHHNYIHDLKKGEGFYIGHNQWSDSTQHRLNRIYIYHNKLENIPWDGIQVGGTKRDSIGRPGNAEIYGNTIVNYGIDTNAIDHWQNNGINLSSGFSGKCYNNFIKRASGKPGGNGIITGGIGDVHVFNNIIVNAREAGILANPSVSAPAEKARKFYFYNNTIIQPGSYGVVYKLHDSEGYFANNIVAFGKGLSSIDPGCVLNAFSNWRETSSLSNLFQDPSKDDYRLKASGSEVVDAGANLSITPYNLKFDYEGSPRSYRFDIGAYEWMP